MATLAVPCGVWPTRYGHPGRHGLGTGSALPMGNIWMRTLPLVLLAVTAMSGCTYLPAAGPTASAIQAGSEVATADGGLLARYEIIDVTPAVIEALRGRPLDSLLASFGDHRPSAEPVIGIGDMVSVSIWEAGSGGLFSGPLVADRFSAGSKSALIPEQPVGRDGAISVPYAGRIKVAGRRPQDVQALIENELAGKAIQPQVLVSVTRPISQAVTVTGEGAAGARLPLSGHGDRILDVIAAAGGNRSPVSETFVRLSRGPVTATVPLTTVVS
ncbi:polysaccharide export outer membrane protein, partial [Methylobacterium phyllostachyos]